MADSLYLGLDLSTQGAKFVLVNNGSGETEWVSAINFDRDLPEYGTVNGVVPGLGEGVSESDPAMWIKAVRILLGRLRDSGIPVGAIRALSVSGQQHGLVALNGAGELTRKRSKLWNDVSTLEECAAITRKVGSEPAMLREISNLQKPGYTAPKILHFKREDPGAFDRTATFFLVHNYINWFLTGGAQGGVRAQEPGDASGLALWNPASGAFSKAVMDAIDPALSGKLPAVRPSLEFIGALSPALCAEYGFSRDCRVAGGSGDNMMGAAGTGNVVPGLVTVSLGTSGTACTILDSPFLDPEGEIASYCDAFGRYMALLCVSNLANGYNALLRNHRLSHAEFDRLVRQTPPGNRGRILLPWFGGERTPNLPDAAPVTLGFDLHDFTVETLCRAVLEGHILNLYEGYLRMPVRPRTIYLTGGIGQSPSWRRAIADIFNTTVLPVEGEGAALGAAIHAAWADWPAGNGRTGEDLKRFADRFIRYDPGRKTEPKAENLAACDALKKTYLALSRRVRGAAGAESPFTLRKRSMGRGPAQNPEAPSIS